MEVARRERDGMHLRLPLVAVLVAAAAGAAFARLHTGTQAPPVLAIARVSPEPDGASSARGSRRPRSSLAAAPAPIVVYVAGAVVRPGLYTLARRSRAAGGALPNADLVAVNLAAPVADGDEVAVLDRNAERTRTPRRTRGSRVAIAAGSTPASRRRARKHGRKKRHTAHDSARTDLADAPPIDLVDINTADASELETLPGIGSALAERIVTVRDASGPFASSDDLLDVGGMTQGRLDVISPYIVVH